MSEAEGPQPGECEGSHFLWAPGGEEEEMKFHGHESQEACESQQSLEGWLQLDPMRRVNRSRGEKSVEP